MEKSALPWGGDGGSSIDIKRMKLSPLPITREELTNGAAVVSILPKSGSKNRSCGEGCFQATECDQGEWVQGMWADRGDTLTHTLWCRHILTHTHMDPHILIYSRTLTQMLMDTHSCRHTYTLSHTHPLPLPACCTPYLPQVSLLSSPTIQDPFPLLLHAGHWALGRPGRTQQAVLGHLVKVNTGRPHTPCLGFPCLCLQLS